MASLRDLNAELVDHIVSRLDNAGLRAFRLTSKECWNRCLKQFASRVCNQKYLIAEHSLEALLAISKHKTLGPALKTIRFASCYLDPEGSCDSFDMELACAKDKTERKKILQREKALKQLLKKQKAFSIVKAVKMLEAILSEAPNVEAVEVGEWNCDYELSHTERPFGAGQYMKKTLMVPNTILQIKPHGEVQGLAYSFAVVVRALAAASSKTQIRSLSAHSWDGVKHTTIRNMSSKELSSMVSSSAVYMALGRAFDKLRSISLSIMFWEHDYTGDSTPLSRIWLADLLGRAYHLEHLSLISDGWTWRSSKHEDESAFGTFVKTLSSGSLCNLKCLELCHIEFTEDELLAMISKFSNSLTDLTLTDVKLRSGQWAAFLQKLQDLGNVQSRYNLDLSWLLETNTVNPGQSPDVIVFDEDGIDNCSHFWHLVMLRTKSCKHVNYLTKDKNHDLLQHVKKRPMSFFEHKF